MSNAANTIPADSETCYAVVTTDKYAEVESMHSTKAEAYAEIKVIYNVFGFRKGSRKVVKGTWSESAQSWTPAP